MISDFWKFSFLWKFLIFGMVLVGGARESLESEAMNGASATFEFDSVKPLQISRFFGLPHLQQRQREQEVIDVSIRFKLSSF